MSIASRFAAVAACLAFAPLAAQAYAQTSAPTCVEFEILGRGVDRVYNPYRPFDAVDNFTVRATRLSSAVTSVRFLLVDSTPQGSAPKFGVDGPAEYGIDWVQDQRRQVFVTGAQALTQLNSASLSFNGRQNTETSVFRLNIPRGQTAIAGRQVERLAVRYQCFAGHDDLGGQRDQYNGLMELSLNIPRIVSAFIGGAGQQHGEIAFGTLGTASNLSKSVSVSVMSTLPYAVDISSENGLRLQRAKLGAGEIPYKMAFAGLQVTGNATMQCPVTPMPAGESRLVQVTLDGSSVRNQPAGDYSDTITLTFRPSDGYAGNQCSLDNRPPPL